MTRWLGCGLLGLALLGLPTAHGQLPPARALQSLKTSDGLAVSLWASEPQFVNPTCMDVDHLGRVWVCESVNYRNKLRRQPKLNRPAGDRIVILEDTRGAGAADKATTFYQHPDLIAPLGIAVARDPAGPGWKVFLCHSPDILVLEDKDGDGKADGPPRKLLSGFRGFDHDHGVHGILIGPDSKLYFSVGDSGVAGLQSSDGKGRAWTSNGTDCRAGTIWRCDLDGKNLQLIAHNFRNQYEPCVDSFGTVFVSDNDDDGNQQTRICHVLPGGNYGYHPRGRGETHWHEEQPGVVPKILRTYFGSPTGMCVYEGKLLPRKYHGQPLHTDAGPRHVRAYPLKLHGASYAAEREDMVESTDNWFRPADVCVAPDGSVFVADWYDPGVGGHGMGDTTRGRVYRITPKGYKGYQVPKVDLTTNQGVLAALASPNLAVRYMAMAHLGSMKAEAVAALLRPASRQKEDPFLRARALWQLARVTGRSDATLAGLQAAMNDPDPRFQVLGVRLAKDFLQTPGGALAMLGRHKAAANADPAVLREFLIALRDVDAVTAKDAICELMKRYDGKDRFYLAAVGIAVGHHDAARREAILADFDKQFPQWDDRTAGLVWELRPPAALPLLEKRLADRTIPAEHRARIIDILAASADADAGRVLLRLLQGDLPAEARDRIVANLQLFLPTRWQKLRTSAELNRVLDAQLAQPQTRATGLALIAAAGRTDRLDAVLKVAKNNDESAEVRRVAVATLAQLPTAGSVDGLTQLLPVAPPGLQGDVARALGDLARGQPKMPVARQALKALQDAAGDSRAAMPLREAAVIALTASPAGSNWLLERHAKKELPPPLAEAAGRILRYSPFRPIQNKALIAFPAPGRLDLKKLPSIAVLAARRGDAAKGKRVLAESFKSNLQCLKCHGVRGAGGQVGPDLSMIGKKASRENLFESLLYPSKAIADQFVTWQVTTMRGLSMAGLIVEETPDHVIVRDAEGRDTRVLKKEIESRTKNPKSLMPEDLITHLAEEELIDLVEYLLTLKTPALTVPSWHVIGPFDNGGSMGGLDRVFAPEKGIDLKAIYAGKHGKIGWQTVRPDASGYVDLQAFFAPRSAQIVSYLTQQIESPAELDATILLGTDDGAKLWLNGQLVHTTRQTRAAAPEQDAVRVRLKKGANRVVLKINNGDGPHGFYFTVLAEQELKAAK